MQMLRTAVLLPLCSVIGLFAQGPSSTKKSALPADLVSTVRQDFKVGDKQQCLDDKHLRMDQAVATEWLSLNNSSGPVLLVRGISPCLASGENGQIILYGQFSEGWRRMLDGNGHDVQPLHSGTKGWADLGVAEQQSPSESIQRVYRFDGFAYKASGCRQVQVADASGQPLAKPVSKPCPK